MFAFVVLAKVFCQH